MSAYLLGTDHIDLLVSAMVQNRTTGYTFAPGNRTLTQDIHPVTDLNADQTGQMLMAENVASVQYRYRGEAWETLPGPVGGTRPEDYRHRMVYGSPALAPVSLLQALDGYEYQTCEHPTWHDSMAHALVDALRRNLITGLSGYREAGAWEWSRPEPTVTRIA